MKIDKIFLSIALSFISLGAAAQGQTADIDSLSREIAALSASATTLQLKAEAAESSIKASNRLPDPVVELEHLWGAAGNKLTASVSQEFELPGVYRSRSAVAAASRQAAETARQVALADKAYEAKLAMIDLIYQTRCLLVLGRLTVSLDSVAVFTEKGYRGGELTLLDLRKVGIRRSELERRVAETQLAADDAAARISLIADGSPQALAIVDGLLGVTVYPDATLQPLAYYSEGALVRNPLVQQGESSLALARANEKLARAERLPRIGAGFIFNREEGQNFNGASLSVSLPLWSSGAKKKEARLDTEIAVAESEAARRSALSEIEALHRSAELATLAVERQTEALGELDGENSWVGLLQRALKAGRISTLEYLNESAYFFEAMLALEESMHARAQLMSSLERYTR